MKGSKLILVSLIPFISCRNEVNNILYIGAFGSLDRLIPYPFLLLQEKDSISLINNKGEMMTNIV